MSKTKANGLQYIFDGNKILEDTRNIEAAKKTLR